MYDGIMPFFYHLTALWETAFHCHQQSLQTSKKGHCIYGASSHLAACVSLCSVKGQPMIFSPAKSPSAGTLLQTKTSFFTWHFLYHPLQIWDISEVHNVSGECQCFDCLTNWAWAAISKKKRQSQPCTTARTHAGFWPRTPNGFPLNDTLLIANLAGKALVPSMTQRAKVSVLCWLLWSCSQRGTSEE